MQPINYLPQVDPIGGDLAEAVKLGAVIRQARAQREEINQAEQFRTDLQTAIQSKDPAQLQVLAARYPKMGAQLKASWEMMNEEQRASEFNAARETFYAIKSGRPDVALGVVDEQIAALKNAGKDPKKLEQIRAGIERDPDMAAQYVGAFMASVAPKEFAETLTRLGGERRADELQPDKVTEQRISNEKLAADAKKAESDAQTAAVTARFAESNAVKDLEKKGWDIKKVANDIEVAKQNVKIAAMNAAIGREANQIKREQLQLDRDKAIQERDEKIRTKTADVESARATIDNMLNTADRVLSHPGLSGAVGSIAGRMPSLTQESADFDALVETLGSQAFLAQVPSMKGLGALSNAEGAKLQSALQSLDTKQSPEQFRKNVEEAQRLITKARNNLTTRYGIPDTVPDTPAAAAATPASEIDRLVSKYAPSMPPKGK